MARRRVQQGDPLGRLQNFARLVELKGLTQTELAREASLGTAYVNQLLTGRKKSPSLNVLDRLATALQVSAAVLIDRRLSEVELRTELSQGALRAALASGIDHPKFSRFRGTEEAPVTVDGWQRLARILEIADDPPKALRHGGASRSRDSHRK